jgi:hypothetical protein
MTKMKDTAQERVLNVLRNTFKDVTALDSGSIKVTSSIFDNSQVRNIADICKRNKFGYIFFASENKVSVIIQPESIS